MTRSEPDAAAARYRLKFLPEALEEWRALDGSAQRHLRKLLQKRLQQPHVPGGKLHGDLRGCYKIKLRQQGLRLVYAVEDDVLVVLVLAVGKREKLAAYEAALERLMPPESRTTHEAPKRTSR